MAIALQTAAAAGHTTGSLPCAAPHPYSSRTVSNGSTPLRDLGTPSVTRERHLTVSEILQGLVSEGFVHDVDSERVRFQIREAQQSADHPLSVVAAQGLENRQPPFEPLNLERLTRWLAQHVGLEYLRIDPLKVDIPAVTGVIKHAYATRFNILPVAVSGREVTVATAEPFVREWEYELGSMLKLRFERVIANPETVSRFIDEFYALSRNLDGAVSNRTVEPLSTLGNLEQLVELDQIGQPDADDQHVIRLVDWLLQYAFDQRASDIHLEPRRESSRIRFRIDGVLHLVNEMPTPVLAAVVSRLKALGRLDVVERRRPQDGRIKTKTPQGKEVELRLSSMPTAFGEKLVVRIFDPDVLVKSMGDLGFSDSDQHQWESMVAQPHGMIIVTGPTGSGKTTTLYSALKRLARPELNVCTIENPIELVDPHLNQMSVQHNIGLDFATGVRTLLRQDPDIIMVGEIRDRETADTAIQAALTGHLVLTTLHTNDAPSSVTRLLDLGLPPYLIKSAVLGVVAQRLVRTLCDACKKPGGVTADEWKALTSPLQVDRPAQIYHSVGCDECRHTGFRGRIGIYEILQLSSPLRTLITEATDVEALRQQAISGGMQPLRVSGAEKVQRGVTTPGEVLSVVQDDPLGS